MMPGIVSAQQMIAAISRLYLSPSVSLLCYRSWYLMNCNSVLELLQIMPSYHWGVILAYFSGPYSIIRFAIPLTGCTNQRAFKGFSLIH